MRKVISLLLLIVCLPGVASSQNEDMVLLTLEGKKITLADFEYIYQKNNLAPQVLDPKTVDEYLDLFVNFNLKVHEALILGLDTHMAFRTELQGYRKQLAQPYLNDQQVTSQLLQEAYQRMQWDIRASHILINLPEQSNDTLRTYRKAMEIRERILRGESFETMAIKYSDDPSARDMEPTPNRPSLPGNRGDLGYFTVLDMVYPFETAAYQTPQGEISMPVRSAFGYHLIKVTHRKPAMGKVRVAHIMASVGIDAPKEEDVQARQKLEDILAKIAQGEDFASLAERFSDDQASGRRAGELPPFTVYRMVPEFIKAIGELETPGDITGIIRTQYGWHIIQMLDREPFPTFEEIMPELRARVARDSRATLSQQVVVDRLKDEYGYKDYPAHLKEFYTWVDQSVFEAKWSLPLQVPNPKVLFSFAGKNYLQTDFASYIERNQMLRSPEAIPVFVDRIFSEYVKSVVIDYEDQQLERKHPEFARIMKEYHDGILLFELMDQKVWSKAIQDTLGLQEFFQKNITDYMWERRLDAAVYRFASHQQARSALRDIQKGARKGQSPQQIADRINRKDARTAIFNEGVFTENANGYLRHWEWKVGVSEVIPWMDHYLVLQVHRIIEPQAKDLNDIRGIVIADYQNYLEKQWVDALRKKYHFELNPDAVKKLQQSN